MHRVHLDHAFFSVSWVLKTSFEFVSHRLFVRENKSMCTCGRYLFACTKVALHTEVDVNRKRIHKGLLSELDYWLSIKRVHIDMVGSR